MINYFNAHTCNYCRYHNVPGHTWHCQCPESRRFEHFTSADETCPHWKKIVEVSERDE